MGNCLKCFHITSIELPTDFLESKKTAKIQRKIDLIECSRSAICNFEATVKMLNMLSPQYIQLINIESITSKYIVFDSIQIQTSLSKIESVSDCVVQLNILESIANGLLTLHDLDIIHGNLSPSNILIDSQNVVYISDYCLNDIRNYRLLPKNHFAYLSPEQLIDKEVTKYSDVWSLGCLLYYLIQSQDLFTGNNKEEIQDNILTIDIHQFHGLDIYNSIIRGCLHYNPQTRIKLKEIIEMIHKIEYTPKTMYWPLNDNLTFRISNSLQIDSSHENIELLINEYNNNPNQKSLFILINYLWNNFNEDTKKMIVSKVNYSLKIYNRNGDYVLLDRSLLQRVDNYYKLNLQFKKVGDAGFNCITQYMYLLTNIQYIDLRFNDITSLNISSIVKWLPNLIFLKSFYIDNNPIEDDGLSLLSDYLHLMLGTQVNKVSYIHFRCMCLKNDGIYKISDHLEQIKNVEIISFYVNKISDDGLKYFSDRCSVLTKLCKLDFNKNSITSKSDKYIQKIIHSIPTLEQFNLASNLISANNMEKLQKEYPKIKFNVSNEI